MPKRSASEYLTDPNKESNNVDHVSSGIKKQHSNIPVIKRSKMIPYASLSNTDNKIPLETKTTTNGGTSNKIYKVVSINGQILLMEQDVSNLNLANENDSENNIDTKPIVHNQEEDIQKNENSLGSSIDNNAENIVADNNQAVTLQQIDDNLDLTNDTATYTECDPVIESAKDINNIDLTESDTENNDDNNPVATEPEAYEQQNDFTIKNHNENKPRTEEIRGYTQTDYINKDTNQDTYELFTENRFKSIYDNPQGNVNIQKKHGEAKIINQKNLGNKKSQFGNVYSSKNQNTEPPRILNLEQQKQNEVTKTDELEIVLDNQHGTAIIRPANTLLQGRDKSALPNIRKQGVIGNPTKLSKKRDVNSIIEDFVDYFADIMNYKWYNDQDILIYGKKGTAMALVHEAKYKAYKANKAKLEELNAAMEIIKRNNQLIANEKKKLALCLKKYQEAFKEDRSTKSKLDEALKEVSELKKRIQKQNDEMKDLQTLKHYINKAFSETQIAMLTHQLRSKNLWSDEDMKKAVFLYQIVSPKAYTFLKSTMKFPLPCRNTVQSWMIEKNIYVKPKKVRNKETTQGINNTTVQALNTNEIKNQLTQGSIVSIQTLDETNIQAQDASTSNIENEYATEAANKPLNESNTIQYEEDQVINETNMNEDPNESTAILVDTNFHAQYAQNVVLVQDTNEVVTETQQAVNMINETQQICQIDGQNVLTAPAYSDGEMILVYLDDNNVNEDYIIEDNCVEGETYAQDDNIANGNDGVEGEIYAQGDNIANGNNGVEGEIYAQGDNIANGNDGTAGNEILHDDENIHNDVHENNDVNDANTHENNNINDNNESHNNNTNITLTSVEEILKWDMDYIKNCNDAKKNLHMLSRMINWKLMCQLCLKPFSTEEELRQHVPIHYFNTYCTTYLDVEKPYQCEFCHEMVVQKTSLVRHHCMHLGITSYNCWYPGCTYVGRNRELLSSHCARHYPRKHQCPSCEACFVTRHALRSHYKRRHSIRGVHRCELCNAVRKSDYTFHLHMRSHNKPPRFKCRGEGCTEAFYSRRALGEHKQTHMSDTRPYKCPHCPLATYTHEFLLKKHMENHEKYRLAHCSKCQQLFDTYSDYYTHIKSDEHKKIVKYTCVCNQELSTIKKFREHKSECQLVLNNVKEKRRRRHRVVKKPVNINKQIKQIETKKQPIIQKENAEQHDVSFDGNIIRATYQRNKTDIVEQNSPDAETGLHKENNQSSISNHEMIVVPKRTYLKDNNTVPNKIILQNILISNQYTTTSQVAAQEKVTVEPVFSSQGVTLLSNCDENDNRNVIQEQNCNVSKSLSKQETHNNINIEANKFTIISKQDFEDSTITMEDVQQDHSELIEEYEQKVVELSNTQPDIPLIDEHVKQGVHQFQIKKSRTKAEGASKNNDVIGALMKQSGCMEQPSKLLEENLMTVGNISQQETSVDQSIKKHKVIIGPKTTAQNVTPVNYLNAKITEQKMVVITNKTCHPNVIIESKTTLSPKMPLQRLTKQNISDFVGDSSSKKAVTNNKINIATGRHIQLNKNNERGLEHSTISIQKPKDGHNMIRIKGSTQKKYILMPIKSAEPDMPFIDHIGEEHEIQPLDQINQSQVADIGSRDKTTKFQSENLEAPIVIEDKEDIVSTIANQENATMDQGMYQKQLIIESMPTTSSNNMTTMSYEIGENVVIEHEDLNGSDKGAQKKPITVLKPNILKKSSLIKFKIKPISEYLSNSQNISALIKDKHNKTNIGIQNVKYVPMKDNIVHSTTSAQTLEEQPETVYVDQIEGQQDKQIPKIPTTMLECCKCGSSLTDPDVVLYRYPNPKENLLSRCEKWAKYMFPHRKSSSPDLHWLLYTEHRMLCDKHFNKTSFIDYSKKKLHDNAVPDGSLRYNIKEQDAL